MVPWKKFKSKIRFRSNSRRKRFALGCFLDYAIKIAAGSGLVKALF
jgi:hypothetical protein